ncbi:hypothetical protein Tcan_07860 [Toxocara canis]|uniref:Uncharacterized protein n=1 Tax=Toxocara canis TaxID=6265 RepID=A0A0B2W0D2_TOXCA|nr:hypothetical protein Tcan_07860 [Toxocara canis]
MVSCYGEYGPPKKIGAPTALWVCRGRRKTRRRKLRITDTYVARRPTTKRCTTGHCNMESMMGRSATTSVWRCSNAASSGSRQTEKLPAASMERTMKSMKSLLFKKSKNNYVRRTALLSVLSKKKCTSYIEAGWKFQVWNLDLAASLVLPKLRNNFCLGNSYFIRGPIARAPISGYGLRQ